jgi:hypothetical protein
MVLECTACEVLVDAVQVSEYKNREDGEPTESFVFLKCPKCRRPMLAIQEDLGYGWDEPAQLYPILGRPISKAVPDGVRGAYEEARGSFRAKAFTAATIMCRKALEGICAEHGAKGRNLKLSLEELRDKGVIDARLFDWADALRLFGNEAAHDVAVTISKADAQDVLVFTNALLEYVFTFRDRFNEFMERRRDSAGGTLNT